MFRIYLVPDEPQTEGQERQSEWTDWIIGGFLATLLLGVFYGTVEIGRAWIFR